jgi:bifunctional ADP-heptose synthase (sugar kinase/adenylyltransferase)
MGEEGFLIQSNNSKWQTDKIAALNQNPKDVSGAGDSLLITSSMILACGGDIWDASLIGSLAAAIQVSRLGNTPLKIDDLTWGKTNPGVWTHHLPSLMTKETYTHWGQYTQDESLK